MNRQEFFQFFPVLLLVLSAALPVSAEGVTLPSGKRLIVIASRATLEEASSLADAYKADFKHTAVFRASNGWYAISVGIIDYPKDKHVLDDLVKSGKIPTDSRVSSGTGLDPIGDDDQTAALTKSASATDGRSSPAVAESGSESDVQSLRAEIERLRAEVQSVRQQAQALPSTPAAPVSVRSTACDHVYVGKEIKRKVYGGLGLLVWEVISVDPHLEKAVVRGGIGDKAEQEWCTSIPTGEWW